MACKSYFFSTGIAVYVIITDIGPDCQARLSLAETFGLSQSEPGSQLAKAHTKLLLMSRSHLKCQPNSQPIDFLTLSLKTLCFCLPLQKKAINTS